MPSIHTMTRREFRRRVSVLSEQVGKSPDEIAHLLSQEWAFMARPGQMYVPGHHETTVYCIGRGFGKTRLGSEAIIHLAKNPELCGHIAGIVARTPAELRKYNIHGPSGILPNCPVHLKPDYQPSKSLLRFAPPPNQVQGLEVHLYTAQAPGKLHSANLGFIWADELREWPRLNDPEGAWKQLALVLRHGPMPRLLVTTTPSRRAYAALSKLRDAAREPTCPRCDTRQPAAKNEIVHPRFTLYQTGHLPRTCTSCALTFTPQVHWFGGSSDDNRELLGERMFRAFAAMTEQERRIAQAGDLDAIRSSEQALFRWGDFNHVIVPAYPSKLYPEHVRDHLQISRVVIGVDPSGVDQKPGPGDDPEAYPEVGIVADGLDGQKRTVLLEDASAIHGVGSDSNPGWPEATAALAKRWQAEEIAFEQNYGRGMAARLLREALRAVGYSCDLVPVVKTKSKATTTRELRQAYRLDPVVHLKANVLDKRAETMEERMVDFDPVHPTRVDRIDAHFHARNRLRPEQGADSDWSGFEGF